MPLVWVELEDTIPFIFRVDTYNNNSHMPDGSFNCSCACCVLKLDPYHDVTAYPLLAIGSHNISYVIIIVYRFSLYLSQL